MIAPPTFGETIAAAMGFIAGLGFAAEWRAKKKREDMSGNENSCPYGGHNAELAEAKESKAVVVE